MLLPIRTHTMKFLNILLKIFLWPIKTLKLPLSILLFCFCKGTQKIKVKVKIMCMVSVFYVEAEHAANPAS